MHQLVEQFASLLLNGRIVAAHSLISRQVRLAKESRAGSRIEGGADLTRHIVVTSSSSGGGGGGVSSSSGGSGGGGGGGSIINNALSDVVSASSVGLQTLIAMLHVIDAEQAFLGMSFLRQKWFRKNALSDYSSVIEEIARCRVSLGCVTDTLEMPTCDFAALLHQLSIYMAVRKEAVRIYLALASLCTTQHMYSPCLDVIESIEKILEGYNEYRDDTGTSTSKTLSSTLYFPYSLFHGIMLSLYSELRILLYLLKAQNSIATYHFKDAIFALFQSKTMLAKWRANIDTSPIADVVGYETSANKSKSSALFSFLCQAHGALVSKFSIYFHGILNRFPSRGDMKTLCAKANIDFFFAIRTFQRRTDAHNISIVFQAASIPDFNLDGYKVPSATPNDDQQLTGLSSFPATFSYPTERPIAHWPNVVSIMMDNAGILNSMSRIVYFYDSRVHSSYFLTQLEPLATLVVIYTHRRAETDPPVIEFLTGITSSLRNIRIVVMLKPDR